jgi:hypothetical protein
MTCKAYLPVAQIYSPTCLVLLTLSSLMAITFNSVICPQTASFLVLYDSQNKQRLFP